MGNQYFDVTESDIIYLQRLDYDLQGYKLIVSTILKEDTMSDSYNQFMKEFRNLNMEYRICLDAIREKYLTKEQLENNHMMTINYNTCRITVHERSNTCKVIKKNSPTSQTCSSKHTQN